MIHVSRVKNYPDSPTANRCEKTVLRKSKCHESVVPEVDGPSRGINLALLPFLTILMLVGLTASRVNGQLPSASESYQYRADSQQLTEALRAFAWDQRLHLVMDAAIQERMISEQIELPPEKFLNYITHKYGLIWYYDGTSLYIYPGSSVITRSFKLRSADADGVEESLRDLGAFTDRFPFRTMHDGKVVLAIGPPRYLEMTDFVIRTLEAVQAQPTISGMTIAVFPLTYASAADQTLDFQGRSVFIPGIASILQSLSQGQQVGGQLSTYLPRNLPGLNGSGLNRFSQMQRPSREEDRQRLQGQSPTQPTTENQSSLADAQNPAVEYELNRDTGTPPGSSARQLNVQPTIQADTRLNAVVVRDLPDRMAIYQRVIEQLDRPTNLVEITARIIDITEEGVFEWGLPGTFARNNGANSLNVSLSPTDSANLALTLVRDQATEFLAQVKALEQEGYARVASRPSLLTMDHVEAQIDNSETFFVRVEGDFEVDLFDVSIGTTLNIVPHIVENQNGRWVRLRVRVDDGAVLEQTVDEIPRVRSDSITTQALLGEGQSLLIGGLFREEQSETVSRVPILGKLPGVGTLFQSKEHNTTRVERLILIEPRIVPFPAACGLAGSVGDHGLMQPGQIPGFGCSPVPMIQNVPMSTPPDGLKPASPSFSPIPTEAAPPVQELPPPRNAVEQLNSPPPTPAPVAEPKTGESLRLEDVVPDPPPRSSRRKYQIAGLPKPVKIQPIPFNSSDSVDAMEAPLHRGGLLAQDLEKGQESSGRVTADFGGMIEIRRPSVSNRADSSITSPARADVPGISDARGRTSKGRLSHKLRPGMSPASKTKTGFQLPHWLPFQRKTSKN